MSPPNTDPYKRRTSKACEYCRTKRTRCSGSAPCDACISLGLADACYVREKARPRRAPAASKRRKKSSTPDAAGPRFGEAHVHFIRDVEQAIDSWLESVGHHARTSLPGPSKLSNKPAPALPTSRRELQELEDRLIVSHRSLQEFEFLSTARVNDLYMRHRSLPETLTVDQRALVAAVLCLGRMSEIAFHDKNGTVTLGAISPHESREDITYYKLTMQYLEQFGSSSCTALCALHCLQLYVQILGGPEENRDVLGAMSWHARELGLHRRETASAYPSQDKAAHLFFSTLYKDTWFHTLLDAPPFHRFGDYEYDPSISTEVPQTQGILSRLALMESELLTQIHSGKVDTTAPEFILAMESKWWPLMRECADERSGAMMAIVHPYADVRFNWIRLLLRAPCLSHPTLGASSTPIVARSLSRILTTYASQSASGLFHACWTQLRRITTCGQLLVLCHTARELSRHETEELFAIVLSLLKLHLGIFDFVGELVRSFESVAGLLGLAVPAAPKPPAHIDVPDLPFMFDYSMPMWAEGGMLDFVSDGMVVGNGHGQGHGHAGGAGHHGGHAHGEMNGKL